MSQFHGYLRVTLVLVTAAVLAAAGHPRVAVRAASCPLPDCAFFDPMSGSTTPNPAENRSGSLDPVLWGVSRVNQDANPAQGRYNAFQPATLAICPDSSVVLPGGSVQTCNGATVDALSVGPYDNYAGQFLYPRQPFDFADRTGTIQVQTDLLDESEHGSWAVLSVTDQPLPAPQPTVSTVPASGTNTPGNNATPANGVFVSFARQCDGNYCGPAATCPFPAPTGAVSVDQIMVVRNYRTNVYTFGPGSRYSDDGCVLGRVNHNDGGAAGQLNTLQIRVSATSIAVYGTDIGSSAPLKPLAHLTLDGKSGHPAPLTFSRGLVWLSDESYGPPKFHNGNADHEFQWSNLAFDGPVLPRDLGYDVPDHLSQNSDGTVNLGYPVGPNGMTFDEANAPLLGDVADPATATAALVEFNWYDTTGTVPSVSINGNPPIDTPWPFQAYNLQTSAWQPDPNFYSWRTIAVQVPLSELQPGANTITLSDSAEVATVANIDLILAGAGGVVGPAS